MGRQQYLARLALGRSAFADVEGEDLTRFSQGDEGGDEASSDLDYAQQYDKKGRPVKPSTEQRNQAMQNASNAVLLLAGVVEKKDNTERLNELKFSAIRAEREAVLLAEQDAGETLELVMTLLSFANYATESLVRRVMAGLYPASVCFSDVFSGGVVAINRAGLSGAFPILFPGAPASLVHAIVRVLLGATLSTGVEYFSKWLIKQKMRRRTARRVHRALYFACEAVLIGLDVALLPLEYYAYAQRLGIAPTWPLLPNWRILSPSSPTSIHHSGWRSPITQPLLHRLFSPAALMLLQSSLWREQDAEIPIGSQITRFEYPAVFNSSSMLYHPTFLQDPLGYALLGGYRLRERLMRFFGYSLEMAYPRNSDAKYENDRVHTEAPGDSGSESEDEKGDGLQHIHRSTELAHLAPRYLAHRIDTAWAKFILSPLQMLVMASVAQSYMASPLPKTSFARSAVAGLYVPFNGLSPLCLLQDRSMGQMGSFISKLGLSLGLHMGTSVGLFFLASKLVRWQGRRYFDWGSSGTVGGIEYPMAHEE